MDFAQEPPQSSKHLVGIGLVVLVHVGVAYALATGLATKVMAVMRPPVVTKIIEEVQPPPPPEVAPPPPPPPPLKEPPPFIPPPEVVLQQPPPVQQPVIAAATAVPPPVEQPVVARAPDPAPAPPPPAPAPVRVAPVVDAKSCAKPEYPAASKRLQETGAVFLNFLVGLDGRVIDSKVDTSSGFERLDEAALKALSLCSFKPGMVDGKPEQSWHKLKYVWKLER